MRQVPMRAAAAVLLVLLASSLARAATPPPKAEHKDLGLSVGPFVPVGSLNRAYDVGAFATLRGFYFPAKSRHGVRAALWAGFANGNDGIDDGYGYGGEMDYAAHFGGGEAPFYLFIGGGFCGSDFIAVSSEFPGGTQIHIRGSALSAHAGVGYLWKRVFLEAAYIEVFDDQKNYGLVPVTFGVRF